MMWTLTIFDHSGGALRPVDKEGNLDGLKSCAANVNLENILQIVMKAFQDTFLQPAKLPPRCSVWKWEVSTCSTCLK